MTNFTKTDRSTIRSVVKKQLESFQRDDANTAFALASPGIQQLFGTADNFINMVKVHYSPVYRPRSVLFEELALIQNIPTQSVLLLTSEGLVVRALYVMERQQQGHWRIGGCYLIPVKD